MRKVVIALASDRSLLIQEGHIGWDGATVQSDFRGDTCLLCSSCVLGNGHSFMLEHLIGMSSRARSTSISRFSRFSSGRRGEMPIGQIKIEKENITRALQSERKCHSTFAMFQQPWWNIQVRVCLQSGNYNNLFPRLSDTLV